MSIQRSKLVRESVRALNRLKTLPALIYEPHLRRFYDAKRLSTTMSSKGQHPPRNKIAIFVVYQPNGLAGSTFETCKYLTACGYAVLVIANTPVVGHDRDNLLSHIWMLIERPNFGYDFGAYREGLRFIWDNMLSPEAVVILNDSTWFPLFDADTTLSMLASSNWDVGGIFLGKNRNSLFLESYIYHVSKEALNNISYRQEWLCMPISSNRILTIRHCERGHSQRLAAAGHKLGALYSNEILLDRICVQSDQFVYNTLRFAAYQESDLEQERINILSARTTSMAWRATAESHLRVAMQRRNFYNSLPYAAAKLLNYPFLKKGMDNPSIMWRRQWLNAVYAGFLEEPASFLLSEIESRTPAR